MWLLGKDPYICQHREKGGIPLGPGLPVRRQNSELLFTTAPLSLIIVLWLCKFKGLPKEEPCLIMSTTSLHHHYSTAFVARS